MSLVEGSGRAGIARERRGRHEAPGQASDCSRKKDDCIRTFRSGWSCSDLDRVVKEAERGCGRDGCLSSDLRSELFRPGSCISFRRFGGAARSGSSETPIRAAVLKSRGCNVAGDVAGVIKAAATCWASDAPAVV